MSKKPRTYTYAEAIERAKADPRVRIAPAHWSRGFFRCTGETFVCKDGLPRPHLDHLEGVLEWRVWRMVPRPTRAELRAVEAERDRAQADAMRQFELRMRTEAALGEARAAWWQAWKTGRDLVAERQAGLESAAEFIAQYLSERDEALAECTRLRGERTAGSVILAECERHAEAAERWESSYITARDEADRLRERVADLEARGYYPLLDLLFSNREREVRKVGANVGFIVLGDRIVRLIEGEKATYQGLHADDLAHRDWQLVPEATPEPASPWTDCTAGEARGKLAGECRVARKAWEGCHIARIGGTITFHAHGHQEPAGVTLGELLRAPDDETGWQWAPAEGAP